MTRADSQKETLSIPKDVRRAVDQRDCGFCRMCGKFLGERRAIHHIFFGGDRQGIGGRRHHDPTEMVSLCWLPGDMGCHERAHSRKDYWAALLHQAITSKTNVTALALSRQQARANHDRNKR